MYLCARRCRVVVDNGVCETATLVQVHSARKNGVLLEAVAALSDHGVCVRKGYISSDDGRWFMDVFHVTDAAGRKVADADKLLARLESSLAAAAATADALPRPAGCDSSPAQNEGLSLLELIGVDRPGLLSEVFAVLHDLRCSIVDAKAWTHGGRVAALVFVRDEDTGAPIDDAARTRRIESRLRYVLRGGARGARTILVDAAAVGNLDRRLHQLLNEDREADGRPAADRPTTTAVAVQEWGERGYSVVTVSCRDRPKLLFDVVCTLTDLDYVVYHGTFDTDGDHAQQVRPLAVSCSIDLQDFFRGNRLCCIFGALNFLVVILLILEYLCNSARHNSCHSVTNLDVSLPSVNLS